MVCRLLKVSKSGYYSHKCKTDSEKTFVEKEVINCFEKHKGNYGRIRIKKALAEKGIFVSEGKNSLFYLSEILDKFPEE